MWRLAITGKGAVMNRLSCSVLAIVTIGAALWFAAIVAVFVLVWLVYHYLVLQ